MYFKELAITCQKFFIPYIARFYKLKPGDRVLEVGCGDGGNLLPFAEMGCKVLGVDISETRINDAIKFFREAGLEADFIAQDFFELKPGQKYDVVISNDVYEHITDKKKYLKAIQETLNREGVFFISFPAWQMPFGGHQQICKSKVLAHLPFIHLLPNCLYEAILKLGRENKETIEYLLDLKTTSTTIEQFESLLKATQFRVLDRELYLINPHYETKFGMKPRKLSPIIAGLPWMRNFFTTTCFYLLRDDSL